jgi:hypothetical protein
MKKLLVTMLLCLGLGTGAWAQQDPKADDFAKGLTVALSDMLGSRLTLDGYIKACESIGLEMGEYISTLEAEEIAPFLEYFYQCIYYNFAKNDLPKDYADMIITSFKDTINAAMAGEEVETQKEEATFTGTVTEGAEYYAKLFTTLMEDTLDGEGDQVAAEKAGYDMGVYLATLSTDQVKSFREQFYSFLTVHMSRLPILAEMTGEEINDLIGIFKAEYDPIFEMFF